MAHLHELLFGTSNKKVCVQNIYPIIIVNGFFGLDRNIFSPLNCWGGVFKQSSIMPVYEASLGPLSSMHDRACELAAQIKGATVDYGEVHAALEKHARFGYCLVGEGFHPNWSEDNPVHLIGHGPGASTIRCLQHLLAQDYWRWGSNYRWIKSITGISSTHNGSTVTYCFGCDEKTGIVTLDRLELICFIRKLAQMYDAIGGHSMKSAYDFDLKHWETGRMPTENIFEYITRICGHRMMDGKDNIIYSISLQGAYEDNNVWRTYHDTYYFSFVTEYTHKEWFRKTYVPKAHINPIILPYALYMGCKKFKTPPIPHFVDSEWFSNDGIVNVKSQFYPFTSGLHKIGRQFDAADITGFEKGKWHYCVLKNLDHSDIATDSRLAEQREFYKNLFLRLAALK